MNKVDQKGNPIEVGDKIIIKLTDMRFIANITGFEEKDGITLVDTDLGLFANDNNTFSTSSIEKVMK